MSGNHNLPGLILLINLLILLDLPLLKLITIMLLVIHINPSLLELLYGDIVFDKPVAVVL